MTSYIYLSSDAPLRTSQSIHNKKQKNQSLTHFESDSNNHFSFKDYFHSESQKNSSCSKHFSEAVYQVFSIVVDLPKKSGMSLIHQNKKSLQELFNYLIDHFENTQATYVEILFCSEGFENEPLYQERLVTYEWLKVDDLSYTERKFMRIDTKMSEFIFRRRIA